MIRPAILQDYEQVKHIKKQLGLNREKLSDNLYKEKIEKEGFLLYPDLSLEKYTSYLSDIFLVYEENRKILGFIQISSEHEVKKDSPVEWYKPEMKEIYFSQPHAGLHRIALDLRAKGKGIATQLLEEALQKIPHETKYLFSIVVISPAKNNASIVWHEKHGFEKVARIRYTEHAELEDYQSILYAKKLN